MSESWVTKTHLLGFKEGRDYEVISFLVIDKELEFSPFERFLKKDTNTVINREKSRKPTLDSVREKYKHHPEVLDIVPTKVPVDNDVLCFKVDKIDFNHATDCGFGVLRILRGNHKNEYFLYNAVNSEDNMSFMLDIYLILTFENYNNEIIEEIVNTEDGEDLVNALQITDDTRLSDHLQIAFQEKKNRSITMKDHVVKFLKRGRK